MSAVQPALPGLALRTPTGDALGAVYTPESLALALVRHVAPRVPSRPTVLEPSVGGGVSTLTPEERARWEAGLAPAKGHPHPAEPCPHPPEAKLRAPAWSWCPWCAGGNRGERAEVLLGWLRAHGPAHPWAIARALRVRRSVVADLVRLLRRSEAVVPVGKARVRTEAGGERQWVELTVWRAR